VADQGRSRPEKLREQAAAERQKLQEIDRLLARLETRLAEKPPAATARAAEGDRRVFPRQGADLLIRYRWPGRFTPLVGRIRDISRGGLRFSASRELRIGETLQATIHRRGIALAEFGGEMYLEVAHCHRAGQVWEIGARFAFLPTKRFESAERRRTPRHPVRLELAFRVPGRAGAPERGEVRDISAGGMRFAAARQLPAGGLAAIAIVSSPAARGAAGTRITLNALVRVIRCRRVGAKYEIGAQFVG
jgi:c-di-GMP-binding flagellar brake protein YcgR